MEFDHSPHLLSDYQNLVYDLQYLLLMLQSLDHYSIALAIVFLKLIVFKSFQNNHCIDLHRNS